MIPLAKKGDLKKCSNYRTISLISHLSKVLLKTINNRLKVKAEGILAEEHAGFRSGRGTVEQIANVRILGEKCRNHQLELYHNLIDFKKAFDRVWRRALWLVMKKHNIGVGLIKVIASLCDNNSNTVMSNTITLEWSQTTVVVGQGSTFSPCLFNIFLEEIMTATLENFSGTVKIAGREVTTLRFADDIDLLAGSREELAGLASRLDSTVQKYGMEISAEKSKTMVTSRTTTEVSDVKIKVGEAALNAVKTFSHLVSTINEEITSEN